MSTTTQTKCAVLFADVAGSTQLYETLGDEAARLLVGNCLQSLSRVTERHGGRVVKTIGDELMCRFPSADAAVTAARVMQEMTRKMSSAGGVTPSIRAGLHYGSMIEEDGDLFGDAVNLAAKFDEPTFRALQRFDLLAQGVIFDGRRIAREVGAER